MQQITAFRVATRLPVSIERRAALTADLSATGLRLEVPVGRYAPGQPISGYVLYGHKELKFRGRVAWFSAPNPMASVWGELGLKFSWTSPGLRALLSMRSKEAVEKRRG